MDIFYDLRSGKEKEMIKRISALLAALVISASLMTSCGKSDSSNNTSSAVDSSNASVNDSSTTDPSSDNSSAASAEMPDPSLTIEGQAVDTSNLVMVTVAGHDIDFDLFRYYYYYVLNLYAQNYNITPEALASSEETFNVFKTHVVDQIKQDYVAVQLAEQYDIKLDDEDKKKVEEKIAEFKAKYGSEEEFNKVLKQACLTPELYQRLMEQSQLYQKVEDSLLKSGGKLATTKEDFKNIVQDTGKYSRVVHILIPYYSQVEIKDESIKSAYEGYSLYQKGNAKQAAFNELTEDEKNSVKEASKKVADEVLAKAKNGDDFDQLVKEYGWDPGMEATPTGYYVNQDTSFVQEFKDTCFKLQLNEISDLVESTSYGWFIIKRLPVDMDYVEKNIDSLIQDYDMPRINKLYNEMIEKMEVKKNDYIDKMKPDSLT